MPLAGQPLAPKPELHPALGVALVRVALRLPDPPVPEHDGAAAILALRYDTLEGAVVQRVILEMNGHPTVGGIEARAPGHGPALPTATQFPPKTLIQPPRGILLNRKIQVLPT